MFVAEMTRHANLIVPLPPTRVISRFWSARRSLAWSSRFSSPTSSRKSVPPSACSNFPMWRGVGAGERALLVAEELALHELLRDRRRVDDDERADLGLARRRGRVKVDGPRDELLPGPRLALDGDGEVPAERLLDELVDPLHGRAVAYDLVHPVLFGDLGPELLDLAGQLHALLQPPDDDVELDEVVLALRDVVGRAALHGLDGDVGRPLRRDHDDGEVGLEELEPAERLHPPDPGHHDVEEDDVRAAGVEPVEGVLARVEHLDLVVLGLVEPVGEEAGVVPVVVDDEDAGGHGRGGRDAGRIGRAPARLTAAPPLRRPAGDGRRQRPPAAR